MSDLEDRARRALQDEQAETQRQQAAAQQAKADSDRELHARMAETAVASVERVLGVRTRASDWMLQWATTRQGYGDDQYPTVRTEIEGVIVNITEDGDGQLVCNPAGGAGRYFELSLVGFGRAVQYKKDETRHGCRHCKSLIKAKDLAAHEKDCYRQLPWHKKLLR
jgi:hypothetical protein